MRKKDRKNHAICCLLHRKRIKPKQTKPSNTNGLHTVVWFQIFLSNRNNFHTIVWFQVFLSNIHNYMISCNCFHLIFIICLHRVILFQRFIDWLILMSTRLRLFYAEKFGDRVHHTFIFILHFKLSSNYFYFIIIFCLHTVIWFQWLIDWFLRHINPVRVNLCVEIRESCSLYIYIYILCTSFYGFK